MQNREYTILDYKKGVRNIMVATSVCARGLDIKSLVLVINFSCPNHLEDYIHRIGRTGRAGNKGTAITFICPEDEAYVSDIIKALEIANNKVPSELREMAENFKNKVYFLFIFNIHIIILYFDLGGGGGGGYERGNYCVF